MFHDIVEALADLEQVHMLPPTCELCGLAASAKLGRVCPPFDPWGDGTRVLINAVMTAEILYCRHLPPHYSPLTFSAPRLE